MITDKQFRNRFQAFACDEEYPPEFIEMMIEEAVLEIGEPSQYAARYDLALSYLTAHFAIENMNANYGAFQTTHDQESVSVGGVSYKNNTQDYASRAYGKYGSTFYGQKFEDIRNTCVPRAFYS